MKITAIIPAAGSSTRYKGKNKLLENLKGMPVIVHSLKAISSSEEINNIIICSSEDLIPEITNLVKYYNIPKVKAVIKGGSSRQESVFLGLKEIDKDREKPDFVLIHDGARPLISKEIINNAINTTKTEGSAVVAVPVKDTIKKVDSKTKKVIDICQ